MLLALNQLLAGHQGAERVQVVRGERYKRSRSDLRQGND